jgi:PAS domain S-box-containing protein
VGRGRDYRGVPVMFASHRIGDSPWYLLTKIDEREVLAPVRLRVTVIFSLTVGLILLFGAVLLFWWKRTEASFFRDKYLAERERSVLAQHYDFLSKFAHDIILLADGAQRIIEANDQACLVYGYSRAELLALHISDLRDRAHADEASSGFSRAHREQGYVYETWHRRKDGSTFPVEASVRTIQDGAGEYYHEIIRDITERKRAEQALRESETKLSDVFRHMSEGMALHEMIYDETGKAIDYRIVDVNPTFETILGIPAALARGALASGLYGVSEPPFLEVYSKVAESGRSHRFEIRYATMGKDFRISAFATGQGRFATVFEDITKRVRLEAERGRLIDDLRAKNKDLEEVIYAASHDLRSPLVNMVGFAQVLDKSCTDLETMLDDRDIPPDFRDRVRSIFAERIREPLKFIQSANAKMDSLINGLLRLSRLGRSTMQVSRVDMNLLMENVVTSIAYTIDSSGAVVDIGRLPACHGDPGQMNQVFSNLLDNAIKYRDRQRPLRIRVTGSQIGQEMVYCVEDNGPGIPANRIETIWRLFYRINPEKDEPGEGLGLALVRRIVERHRGRAWVESDSGKGSRFYVALPSAVDVFDPEEKSS